MHLKFTTPLNHLYHYKYFYMLDESPSKNNEDPQLDGRWTQDQHDRFISALMAHGKNWKLIQSSVESRTTSQVRSHAQKFFLKLVKIEKERKKNLKKGVTVPSRTEIDLLASLAPHPLTANTPLEVLHFLRKDPKPRLLPPCLEKDLGAERQHTQAHMTLQQVLGLREEESFLASLIKHNLAFFHRDEAFTDLIDLPDRHHEKQQDEETSNKRKKSFSLYEEEEDQDKYYQTIRKMNGH